MTVVSDRLGHGWPDFAADGRGDVAGAGGDLPDEPPVGPTIAAAREVWGVASVPEGFRTLADADRRALRSFRRGCVLGSVFTVAVALISVWSTGAASLLGGLVVGLVMLR